MNTTNRDILFQNLREIYSEHEWIDLNNYTQSIDPHLTQIELNLQCLEIVKKWIAATLGLPVEYEFPYLGDSHRDCLVSKLVNGFCLRVNGSKVVFIPSQNLDLAGCEIPQEWVDLPNWTAEYYVPIQVDLEAKYLHLWGTITYGELKQTSELDPLFRDYQVDRAQMTANLDVLWANCELAPAPKAAISALVSLTATQAQQTIERLSSESSFHFPRLLLPFSQWGAILDRAEYLNWYLKTTAPVPMLTNLGNWFAKQVDNVEQSWQTIEQFINPPQSQVAFRSLRSHLDRSINHKTVRGMSLQTDVEIHTAIQQLYRSQTELKTADRLMETADLVNLMENSTDDNLRWKATEYLWTINPNHPKLPVKRIRDLGIQFAINSLALMISQLPIANDRRAILLRVYSAGEDLHLPTGVKLSLLDENSEPILLSIDRPFVAISRAEPQDSYIQLCFVADIKDRFDVCVSLGEQQFTEQFIV
jgi:hypothetical protein